MGKQFGPIKCKVCRGEHQGTLCTKFNSVKVMPAEAISQPKPLALPAPTSPISIPASSSGRTPRLERGKRGSNPRAGAKKTPIRQQSKPKPLCSHCGLEDGACICAHLGGPKQPKRDRKEYQRNLMREKRAADKLGMDLPTYRAFLEKSK